MQTQKNWVERIKDIPNWIKSTIGFVTLIVGFVLLVQSNLYLSILISVFLLVAVLFLACIYILFAKKKSDIIGGGYFYQFPHLRKWAVLTLVTIPILSALLFSNKEFVYSYANMFIKDEEQDCMAILELPKVSVDLKVTDKEQISSLIDMEFQTYSSHNPELTMFVFTEDSIVSEIIQSDKTDWKGCKDIFERSRLISDTTNATVQKRNLLELVINGNLAFAETETYILYTKDTNVFTEPFIQPYKDKVFGIHLIERWTFIKQYGVWKVKTLVLNYDSGLFDPMFIP